MVHCRIYATQSGREHVGPRIRIKHHSDQITKLTESGSNICLIEPLVRALSKGCEIHTSACSSHYWETRSPHVKAKLAASPMPIQDAEKAHGSASFSASESTFWELSRCPPSFISRSFTANWADLWKRARCGSWIKTLICWQICYETIQPTRKRCPFSRHFSSICLKIIIMY